MSELKSRMEVLREQQLVRIKKLELMYPIERKKTYTEYNKLRKDLGNCLKKYELLLTSFVDNDSVITPLGKVGRAINTDFGICYLQVSIGFLDKVLESLNVGELKD